MRHILLPKNMTYKIILSIFLTATLALNACGAWLYEPPRSSSRPVASPTPPPYKRFVILTATDPTSSKLKRRSFELTVYFRSDGSIHREVYVDVETAMLYLVSYCRRASPYAENPCPLQHVDFYDLKTGKSEFRAFYRHDDSLERADFYDPETGEISDRSYYRLDETLERRDYYDLETGEISRRSYFRPDEILERRDFYDLTTSRTIGRFYYDRQEKLERIEIYDPKTGELTGSVTARPDGTINTPKRFRDAPERKPSKPDLKDWI